MASRGGLFDFEFEKKAIFDPEINNKGVFDPDFSMTATTVSDTQEWAGQSPTVRTLRPFVNIGY